MDHSFQSRLRGAKIEKFVPSNFILLLICGVIIIALVSFFIGEHNGKSSSNVSTQSGPSTSGALRSLSHNSDINTGNLNVTGAVTSINNLHILTVQTISGNSFTFTADSQTTVLKNNKLTGLSTIKAGAILTINAITERDGSLTPLRIIILK